MVILDWTSPLILCFKCSAEAAQEVVSAGADGILVSAHGGRQMDSAPAPVSVKNKQVILPSSKEKNMYKI